MKYFAQGLLITLIGLFLFSSCEKSDSIGLEVDPTDSIHGKYIEDFNINTVTVRDDSLYASNMAQYPLGSFDDPILGSTEAALALKLSLPSSAFTFGTAPLLDSAVLVFRYGREFYGDSLSTSYRIDVHEINEEYNSSGYYSNKVWSYENVPAGSKANITHFAWNDSIYVTQIVKDGPDTAVKVAPQLRIRLDNFAATKLITADAAIFTNNTTFNNYLHGLFLKVTKEQANATGGITFLNLAATDVVSRLDVFYRNTNDSGTQDTNVAAFNVTLETAAITHNYDGTPVKTQLDNPAQTFSTTYVQPMGGLKTKVTFPGLNQLKQLGNIAINKAELVVYTEENTTGILKPAPVLTLYQTDIAGQRQPVPDQSSYLYGSSFDSAKNRYIFNISNYIHSIISGKTEQYPLYIIPSDIRYLNTSSTNITPVATTAARSVLAGKKDDPRYKIKLNIYYTRSHM